MWNDLGDDDEVEDDGKPTVSPPDGVTLPSGEHQDLQAAFHPGAGSGDPDHREFGVWRPF
eukprot:CAMPEP_0204285944 /NCGR_PEP_ID=MMETSP0468-20130131/51765_1 /ASSEMBLY_ACC=CAM_ASM_000383 /TAXON_ID=2969 /ORGANISM="Oxyrrhis marina" /LENGTH=59 /DNA_ID=CAMNT_0051263811 /DNA_START=20 /DNA_END=199 /DNA_ORIENTATION=-